VAFIFYEVAAWKEGLGVGTQRDYWFPRWIGFPLSALFLFFVRMGIRRLRQLGWPWPDDYYKAHLYGAVGGFTVGAIISLVHGLGVLR
jgi:hypothetical protein